jgi:uncharacterized coiled-coil protein SlyX
MKISIIRLLPRGCFLFALISAFLTPVRAQLSPTPDGGYANGNTAEGEDALFSLTSGFDNVAVGYEALYFNTDGIENTGTGYRALWSNKTGTRNTATGNGALSRNITGSSNTATGLHTMFLNTSGQRNTAEGGFALNANTTGSYNIALGYNAGSSLTTGNYNIDIGNVGVADEAGTLRIGTPGKQNVAYVAGIYGVMEPSGVSVTIGPNGHLGTMASSARFKEAIKPMEKASEAVLALQPVTFHYKSDKLNTPQFGLIAEEVAKVNPDLVIRDDKGEIYTVRYDAVNAMLLNEFLKEHRKVEEQQATITRLESKVAKQELAATQQQKEIEALTATVRKVSERVELSTPAPQVAANED